MTHNESPCTYREDAVIRTILLHEMLSKKFKRSSTQENTDRRGTGERSHAGHTVLMLISM